MDDHDLLIRIDESLNEKRIRNLEIKQYGIFTSIVSLLTLIIAKIKNLI